MNKTVTDEIQALDAVLRAEWLPVAIASTLVSGQMQAVVLMQLPVVIWRDAEGLVHAWLDACPHRGMQLSLGCVKDNRLVCAYHGWQFDTQAKCAHIPALPASQQSNHKAKARAFAVQEAYGLIWVCLDSVQQDGPQVLPAFPEALAPDVRMLCCPPARVASSAPRVIENFLDMGHFAFVHTGILGDVAHSVVDDYEVESLVANDNNQGFMVKQCFAWQPQASKSANAGAQVQYSYRVVRPLVAILTKQALTQQGHSSAPVDAIALFLQPIDETLTQVWTVMALNDAQHSDAELIAFQQHIFAQDLAILEHQRPLKLPISPVTEVSISADKMSLAYRRYLKNLGIRYGVIRRDVPPLD